MSCWVEEDAEPLTTWLVLGEDGAEAEETFHGMLQVVDAEVEVEPTWCGGVGPWGWLVVGDALEVEADVTVTGEHREVVIGGQHLSAEESLVELCELCGVRAIDGDGEQASDDGHIGDSSLSSMARQFR